MIKQKGVTLAPLDALRLLRHTDECHHYRGHSGLQAAAARCATCEEIARALGVEPAVKDPGQRRPTLSCPYMGWRARRWGLYEEAYWDLNDLNAPIGAPRGALILENVDDTFAVAKYLSGDDPNRVGKFALCERAQLAQRNAHDSAHLRALGLKPHPDGCTCALCVKLAAEKTP